MKKKYPKSSCLFVLVLMLLAVIFPAVAFAQPEVKTTAATKEESVIGVSYRGHVQNLGNMPTPEGTMIAGPEALGTKGEGLRLEGFWIDLTGDVPVNAGISYQVHVQNIGWQDAVSSGDFAGTNAWGLRIEAIKISLVNLPDYDVYYRGHVQNVGNIPQIDGDWGWVKNGEELGTTGKGLRLEELQIKIVRKGIDLTAYNTLLSTIEKLDAANYSPESWATLQTALTDNKMTEANSQTSIDAAIQAIQAAYDALSLKVVAVYDKPGVYGPETGTQTIEGSVVIDVSGVTLQNLVIKGDLTVSEAVGDGDATLNYLTVEGTTILAGGGTGGATLAGQATSGDMTLAGNSGGITIRGDILTKVLVTKNDRGGIRITVINSEFDDFEVIDMPEGQPIILGGWFKSVMIQVPDLKLEIDSGTIVESLFAGTADAKKSASGLEISGQGTINNFEVGKFSDDVSVGVNIRVSKAQIYGDNSEFLGVVGSANIVGDNASFRIPPVNSTGNPPVIINPPAPPPGGGGTSAVAVSSITVTGTGNATTVLNGNTLHLLADVLPTNATNKAITWSVTNGTGSATISETTGLLSATGVGTVTVKAVAKDGSLKEGIIIITITAPVIGAVNPIVTAGDGKVVLTAMPQETGYAFYYKNTPVTDAANKSALDATDLNGWHEFTANTDIAGVNGTEIFVQVVKVDTNGNKIKAWGETSETPVAAPTLGTLTPTVTAGDGKVVLTAMPQETGYAFYYKNTPVTDAANKPALDATDLNGWHEFTANTDIAGANGTEIFVQVVKVDTNGNKIKAWGEASEIPGSSSAELNIGESKTMLYQELVVDDGTSDNETGADAANAIKLKVRINNAGALSRVFSPSISDGATCEVCVGSNDANGLFFQPYLGGVLTFSEGFEGVPANDVLWVKVVSESNTPKYYQISVTW